MTPYKKRTVGVNGSSPKPHRGKGGGQMQGYCPSAHGSPGEGSQTTVKHTNTCYSGKGETKHTVTFGRCSVEWHLTIHSCSKVGGVYSRHSQDIHS